MKQIICSLIITLCIFCGVTYDLWYIWQCMIWWSQIKSSKIPAPKKILVNGGKVFWCKTAVAYKRPGFIKYHVVSLLTRRGRWRKTAATLVSWVARKQLGRVRAVFGSPDKQTLCLKQPTACENDSVQFLSSGPLSLRRQMLEWAPDRRKQRRRWRIQQQQPLFCSASRRRRRRRWR